MLRVLPSSSEELGVVSLVSLADESDASLLGPFLHGTVDRLSST